MIKRGERPVETARCLDRLKPLARPRLGATGFPTGRQRRKPTKKARGGYPSGLAFIGSAWRLSWLGWERYPQHSPNCFPLKSVALTAPIEDFNQVLSGSVSVLLVKLPFAPQPQRLFVWAHCFDSLVESDRQEGDHDKREHHQAERDHEAPKHAFRSLGCFHRFPLCSQPLIQSSCVNRVTHYATSPSSNSINNSSITSSSITKSILRPV